MTSMRWPLLATSLLCSLAVPVCSVCSEGSTRFTCQANSSEQIISFSSNTSDMDPFISERVWVVEAESEDRHLVFRITDFFSPIESRDCLIVRNGKYKNGKRLRTVCDDQPACGEVEMATSSLLVTYTIRLQGRLSRGFVLKYWSTSPEIQVRQMANYSSGHFLLMAASLLLLLLLAGGVVCLVWREHMREKEKREMAVRRKLQIRRKAISGMSGADPSFSSPDHTDTVQTDTTSFVESLGLGSSTFSV